MAFGHGDALQQPVISTLDNQGRDVMGLDTLAWKYPDNRIVLGSLLTVEPNHFCVLKSCGAVLDVYETGQHQIIAPDKPILGNIVQGFFGKNSPWQYEAIYVQRSKLPAQNKGFATTKEMAIMEYTVDYYVHIDTKDDAVKLVTHLPFAGERIPIVELTAYAGPVIGQAINQIVQLTPMEQVNERIHDISKLANKHLGDFLDSYGVHLNDVKALIKPQDACMRELTSRRAFDMSEMESVRMYLGIWH